MAVLFILNCSTCGEQAVTDEKTKTYIHLSEKRGNVATHQVVIKFVNQGVV